MATILEEPRVTVAAVGLERPNGAALAAFLAAGIGSFGMGFIMILSETGLLSVPTLYEPAGGVTGRTTLAIVVWLVSWALLHFRWRHRNVGGKGLSTIIAVLVGLGILGTFPPFWSVF